MYRATTILLFLIGVSPSYGQMENPSNLLKENKVEQLEIVGYKLTDNKITDTTRNHIIYYNTEGFATAKQSLPDSRFKREKRYTYINDTLISEELVYKHKTDQLLKSRLYKYDDLLRMQKEIIMKEGAESEEGIQYFYTGNSNLISRTTEIKKKRISPIECEYIYKSGNLETIACEYQERNLTESPVKRANEPSTVTVRSTTEFRYDESGNKIKKFETRDNKNEDFFIAHYEYDADNRRIKTTRDMHDGESLTQVFYTSTGLIDRTEHYTEGVLWLVMQYNYNP